MSKLNMVATQDEVCDDVLSSSLERKITDIMECVHNLDGNYDESEVRRVANALRDLTQSEFSEIQSLTFDDLFPNGDSDANTTWQTEYPEGVFCNECRDNSVSEQLCGDCQHDFDGCFLTE